MLNEAQTSEPRQWVVYLVLCSDNSLYCGISNDLQKRIIAHNNKKGAKYTRGRTPVTLINFIVVGSKSEALKIEIKIKKLSKKDKLKYFNMCFKS